MPCKCTEYVDADGIGNCLKRDSAFNELFSCFVKSPSSCIDAKDAQNFEEFRMYQKSAIACEDKNERKTI